MTEIRRFPPTRRRTWQWQMDAACRGADTAVFYHPDNERGPSRRRREVRAKEICKGCPVIEECLRSAVETREPYGVWGGLSVEERQALFTLEPV